MSKIFVKYAGSPVFEATAAGPVPGLLNVQAWFTKAQLKPITEWANTHTASHGVNGIGYDPENEEWFEIPGINNDLTGTYQLLNAEEIQDDDIAHWREDENGLIHLGTIRWEVSAPEPEPPTIGDAFHALVQIGTLLGESQEWSAADYLERIADLVGTVLPHPRDWDTEADGEYGERARSVAAGFLG